MGFSGRINDVLITGSAGFIGHHLGIRMLQQENYQDIDYSPEVSCEEGIDRFRSRSPQDTSESGS